MVDEGVIASVATRLSRHTESGTEGEEGDGRTGILHSRKIPISRWGQVNFPIQLALERELLVAMRSNLLRSGARRRRGIGRERE